MTSSLAQRIFHAHLELSYRLGRRVTLAEFGALIGEEMGRGEPFTAAAVSRWEKGVQIPSPRVIEAIAAVTQVDPGWISHGDKTLAPRPAGLGEPQARPVSQPEAHQERPQAPTAEPPRTEPSTRTGRGTGPR